jgi:hypothetical protein
MAEDWIKVEKATPTKPELLVIARICNCTHAEAFLAWFRFYSWADSQTADGFVRFLSACDADKIGTLVGFGDALQRTGWVQFTDDGCRILKWEKHNGRSAKRRALDAEAKIGKRSAKRRQNVGLPSGQIADLEKEKEKEKDTHIGAAPITPPSAARGNPDTIHSMPPTAEQVTNYAEGLGYQLDGAYFCDHYAKTGWKAANGQSITDWRAVVRTWKKNDEQRRHLEAKAATRAGGNGLAVGQVIHDERPEAAEARRKFLEAEKAGKRGF